VKLLHQYISLVNEWLTTRQGYSAETLDKRLANCLIIRLLRKALLEKDLPISTGLADRIIKTNMEG